MVCPHGQEELGQCGHGGRGQFFTILCGRLLWTTPNDTKVVTYVMKTSK